MIENGVSVEVFSGFYDQLGENSFKYQNNRKYQSFSYQCQFYLEATWADLDKYFKVNKQQVANELPAKNILSSQRGDFITIQKYLS